MLDDIRSQPDSLTRVIDYQFGQGATALREAGRRLADASRIVISGMGASLYAAMPLGYLLSSRGLAVSVVETSELLHYQHRLCSGAQVVLVSRSGNTVEVTKLMPMLRGIAAGVIGVTNEPDSALARESDLTVLVNSGRDEMVAVQTYTGTVMTMLLMGAGPELRGAAETAVTAVASAIERFTAAGVSFDADVIYLIGRGPSLASVHEGALLFNETAKLPSVAAPAGTFRHGPVEVAGPGFHAIVFATQETTRELDLALAADLERMGAQVVTVGTGGTWPLPETPPAFWPVVEILPVQFAALRTAESRGIRPGAFRYVSQVTTSESGFKEYSAS